MIPTIGVEFATKTVKLLNGEKVKAQIWDTGERLEFLYIFNEFSLKPLLFHSWTRAISFDNKRVISYIHINYVLNSFFRHYRRAVGALVVYDVTKEKSFANVRVWIESLKYQAEPEIVIILVGNKIDLCEKNPQMRKVTKEEAQNFAQENKLLFEETSAITDQNITEVFERLLQGISYIFIYLLYIYVCDICR